MCMVYLATTGKDSLWSEMMVDDVLVCDMGIMVRQRRWKEREEQFDI